MENEQDEARMIIVTVEDKKRNEKRFMMLDEKGVQFLHDFLDLLSQWSDR